MLKLFKNFSSVLTLENDNGYLFNLPSVDNLKILYDYSIVTENNLIKDFIPNNKINSKQFDDVIDCKGKIALPGMVECHTHTVFAGSRANEFRLKLQGVSYEEIAKKGGGIKKTVRAVRNSSPRELFQLAARRIWNFISQGVTTIEIKSGYGLNFDDEIKILRVINQLNKALPIDVVPTFLGAHVYPDEFANNHPEYINLLTEKIIPFVANNNLAESCDAFCEVTAFSPTEVEQILTTAKNYGLKIKLHTDQFNSIGGLDVAINLNAASVEHLEAIKESDIPKLKNKNIVAVLLPGVSFFLNHKYAPAKKLAENNLPIAISTDYNPGSSNIINLHFVMQLAALKMGLTIEQIIPAVTINAAKALGLSKNTGSLQINKAADIAIFNTEDYADIFYNIHQNLLIYTVKNGEIIYSGDENNF